MKRPPLQRGGFITGLVVGLLVGLGVALAVALYVTKTPVPFIDKLPQRTAEQDAAEAEKNKNWDPNAPLAGKNPARPPGPAARTWRGAGCAGPDGHPGASRGGIGARRAGHRGGQRTAAGREPRRA